MIGDRVLIKTVETIDGKKKEIEVEVTVKDKFNKTNDKQQQFDAYVGHDDEGTSYVFAPFDIKRFITKEPK